MSIFVVIMIILSGLSVLGFIVGQINPDKALWFMDEGRRNKQSVAIIYIMSFILSIILSVVLSIVTGNSVDDENIEIDEEEVSETDVDESGNIIDSNGNSKGYINVEEDTYDGLRNKDLKDNHYLSKHEYDTVHAWVSNQHKDDYSVDTLVEENDGRTITVWIDVNDSVDPGKYEKVATELNDQVVDIFAEVTKEVNTNVKVISRIDDGAEGEDFEEFGTYSYNRSDEVDSYTQYE